MSRADRERWNRKYAAGNPHPDFAPDPILTQYAQLLDGNGWALDVACGVGHNALYLARRGYDVLAVDGSLAGLQYGRAAAHAVSRPVHFVAADLDHFAPPPERFSLVLVVRFLSRPLLPRLKEALVPGGLMIYQTFNLNWRRANPAFNPDYLLAPGELAEAFGDFEVIATNDAMDIADDLTYWIGRRPAARAAPQGAHDKHARTGG
jgi:tellurite methyltransferase